MPPVAKLPPVTVPVEETNPPVNTLPPVMLPVALAVPPVAKFPPVIVPVALMVVPAEILEVASKEGAKPAFEKLTPEPLDVIV